MTTLHSALVAGFFALLLTPLARAEGEPADHPFLGYRQFTARAGVGATFAPDTFAVAASVEYNLDRFLSFGPMLQAGFRSGRNLFILSGMGRLTAPLYATRRVEASFHTGPGVIFRESGGFNFRNFAYALGADADVFVIRNLTCGLGMTLNLTSASGARTVWLATAGASYHF